MRGRSNVGGGNGIFVNGDIDFYTVAEENSISAGDFVSRKIIPQIKQLYSSNVTIGGGDEVGENLYLFIINNYLTLIEYNGINTEVVYSYTAYKVPEYYYVSETGRIWSTIEDPYYYIATFKVENKKIVLEKTFIDKVISGSNSIGIYVKGNVFIIFSFSSAGNIHFYCYTVEGDRIASEEDFEKSVTSLSAGETSKIRILNNFDSRFYFVSTKSSNSGYNEASVGYVNVSASKADASIKSIHSISSYSTVDITTSRVYEKNKKAFFLYSESERSYRDVNLCVYDMESEHDISYNISGPEVLPSGEARRFMDMSGFVSDEILLAKINENFFLLKYSWVTGEVGRTGNIIELDNRFYDIGVMIMKENRVARIGRYATWFTVDGETLMAGEDRKIVQSFDENMGAIGLAKNSGKAGTTIAVYVPRR